MRIAVVGGGATGAISAVHLARGWVAENSSADPLEVVLYDAGARPARGIAYATADARHLLNVPAAAMSALDDDAGHYCRWVAMNADPNVGPDDFRPRAEYGDYLADTLAEHAGAAHLTVRRGRVRALLRLDRRYRVVHADGDDVVHAVVLALGYGPPAQPEWASGRTANSYVADPWAPDALGRLAAGSGPVLLLGSGLSAIDVALSLAGSGREIVAVSRHGLVPRAHLVPLPEPYPLDLSRNQEPLTAEGVETLVRAHVDRARAEGFDWRAAIDGLRPVTNDLWRRLPLGERRRFLAGPRREWEVLRHRMAPQVAARIAQLKEDGRFTVLGGRLELSSARGGGWRVSVRRDGVTTELRVATVVNCTGPTLDVRRPAGGLGEWLLGSGLVRPDPLGMGIATRRDGAVPDRAGRVDGRVWTLGPLRRGALYESTAIPEIRAQAADLTRRLSNADGHGAASMDACDTRCSSTYEVVVSSSSAAEASVRGAARR